jgi:cell division protein FtsL
MTPAALAPATVRSASRLSSRGKAFALLGLMAFFTFAALAHVWVRLQIVRLGYGISRETEKEKDLQQAHRKLEVERALLRNPERLERLAREKLALTLPDPGVIQSLRPLAPGKGGRASARKN